MFMSGSDGCSILMSVPNLSGDTVVLGTEGADPQQFFCFKLNWYCKLAASVICCC